MLKTRQTINVEFGFNAFQQRVHLLYCMQNSNIKKYVYIFLGNNKSIRGCSNTINNGPVIVLQFKT